MHAKANGSHKTHGKPIQRVHYTDHISIYQRQGMADRGAWYCFWCKKGDVLFRGVLIISLR